MFFWILEFVSNFGFLFMIFTVIIIFTVFQFGVYHEGKIILRELTDESNTTGYIPKEHLSFLPYTSKRYKKGWLPSNINQRDYVKTATKLALRKNQVKTLKSGAKISYQKDVDSLRGKIYIILFGKQQAT